MKTLYISIWRTLNLTYNNRKKDDNNKNKRRKIKVGRTTTLCFLIQPWKEDER